MLLRGLSAPCNESRAAQPLQHQQQPGLLILQLERGQWGLRPPQGASGD